MSEFEGYQRPGAEEPAFVPWGPLHALAGVIGAAVLLFLALIAGQGIVSLLGHEMVPEDAGDPFTRAGEALDYADRKLRAAVAGTATPTPPDLVADVVAARVFYATAAAGTLALAAVAVVATGIRPRRLSDHLGLDRVEWGSVWKPLLLMVAAYIGVFGYSQAAEATGIDLLIPDEQTPRSALRDGPAFALFGILAVVAAPVGEEMLFRGLVFGGLTRWGFWPAALVSGFLFALSHVDPGIYIPFTAIGVLFAWLFWRTGSILPSIACHAFFNGTSFALLALTR